MGTQERHFTTYTRVGASAAHNLIGLSAGQRVALATCNVGIYASLSAADCAVINDKLTIIHSLFHPKEKLLSSTSQSVDAINPFDR